MLTAKLRESQALNSQLEELNASQNSQIEDLSCQLAQVMMTVEHLKSASKGRLMEELDDWKAMLASAQSDRERLQDELISVRSGGAHTSTEEWDVENARLRDANVRLEEELEEARKALAGATVVNNYVRQDDIEAPVEEVTAVAAVVEVAEAPGTASKMLRRRNTLRTLTRTSLLSRVVQSLAASCQETLLSMIVGFKLVTGGKTVLENYEERRSDAFIL